MKITKSQYVQALSAEGVLKDRSIELLNMLYDAPSCKATAPQLAQMLGYSDFPPVNALIGKLGKRIAKHLGIDLPKRENNSPGWWKVLVHGETRPEGFTWSLRNELFDALVDLGLLQDSDPKLYPEVVSPATNLSEGKKKQVFVNAVERNGVARTLCIKHFGAQCAVCGLDFGRRYGEIGVGFIHVHHLLEISSIGMEYKVNPITDLRPVCPNCHAMLHQRRPAYSIDDLRGIIGANT
jgi:5-methylcytosine-specific restriction enzyme A